MAKQRTKNLIKRNRWPCLGRKGCPNHAPREGRCEKCSVLFYTRAIPRVLTLIHHTYDF